MPARWSPCTSARRPRSTWPPSASPPLCDAAADRGLQVALEFPAFATIADVATAWDVARLADRPNAGVLVDLWHHRRGGNDDEALRAVDGSRVYSVQLSDAAGDPVGPPLEDVMHRCLPGDGDFGVVEHLRTLDALGVRAPIGIEVFDEALLATGARHAAQRLAESLRAVVSEALGVRRVAEH